MSPRLRSRLFHGVRATPSFRASPRAFALVACALTVTLALPLAGCASMRPSAPAARKAPEAYPRLALWWPDLTSIETSDVARYDLVILQDYERDKAVALRGANPSMVILDSTNACELDYHPGDLKRSAELAKVPAQWLLTQVGSTLASAVDAQATKVAVREVVGPGGLVLFAEGDAIVADDEIMQVTAIDTAARTLTVKRGAVKPAAAHKAGTRVAAAVSFYDDSLMLDVSANCPPGRAFDSTTDETWAQYAARKDAAMVADPIWSGVMTDRTDEAVAWLTYDHARSLDPGRKNRLPDYAKLDRQWAEGVRDYERRLRGLLGERVLLANWCMPNTDLLNGQIFEAFPRDDGHSYSGSWYDTVFGPLVGHGGYLGIWRNALSPRTNVIATYRNDEGRVGGDASPIGSNDYRKMRFGLTTALLGDGLFAYEVNAENAEGHFYNTIFATWFDEYDGAGLGRGYLGTPSSEVTRVAQALTTDDLVGVGAFDTGRDVAGWHVTSGGGYAADLALDSNEKHGGTSAARFTVGGAGGVVYRAMLDRGGIAVAQGADYTISFWARAEKPRRVSIWVQQAGGTRSVLDFGQIELGTEWREYQVSAPAKATEGAGMLHLGFGETAGTAWLDDLKLQRGSMSVWRRDFSGGVVLVNASSSRQSVDLGGSYRKLTGTQAPDVNDGALVTHVDLPALDGLILVTP